MTNLIRANMELVGLNEVRRIATKDAPAVSTNCKQFVSNNELGYYILCNTWLFIVKEYSEYGWMHLLDAMARRGLFALISEAQDAATQLIESGDITDTIFRPIWLDVRNRGYNPRVPSNDKEIGVSPISTMLMVVRYPKRFSPVYNDKVQAASLKKFLEVENRTKLIQRRGYSRYIMHFVHGVVQDYMPWDTICAEIDNIFATNDLEFTSGVGFDSRSNLGSKLIAISKEVPEYFQRPFGIPYAEISPSVESEYWGDKVVDTVRAVKVQAVPKSYKASRIIAMENTYRQGLARSVARVLDKYLPRSVPIHDQGVNQQLAYLGSVCGQFATLDLSNASDCISKVLFEEVYPKKFTDRIRGLLGTHTLIDDKLRIMQQMSTAGNALTFILESMTFDIICRAAKAMYEVFCGPTVDSIEWEGKTYAIPSVYGDDQIVHCSVAALTIEFLEALGFIVNEAKSYLEGPYRESCGAEYYDGVDVSSYYFPRFPILGTINEKVNLSKRFTRDSFRDVYIDTRSSLISLQHRLYGVSYPAARFIWGLIIEDYPKMTRSLQGSRTSDLWDYEATGVDRNCPHGSHIGWREGRLRFDTWMKGPWSDTPDGRALLMRADWAIISRPLPEWTLRVYKTAPSVRYKLDKPVPDIGKRLFDLYRYQEFLKSGPKYSDWLSEVLRVSDAPITLEQAFGTPEMIWGLHEATED